MNVFKEIESIALREAESDAPFLESRIDDAITAMLGPGTGDILEKLYGQYVIRIGGRGLSNDSEKLTWMRPLEIAAAPELLGLIRAGNLLVLVGRYWTCTDEQLLDVDPGKQDVSADASARFRHDMVALADHGKYHPFAGRGFAHWRIGAKSGTIVLTSWNALAALPPDDPDERDVLFRRIDRQLAELRKS